MKSTAASNKAAILHLYETILNNRKLEQLDSLIDQEYTNPQGAKGVAAFKKGITDLLLAFPDAQWQLSDIIAEDDKVFVLQKMTGTHDGPFQQIPATHKATTNTGMSLYTLKKGKIVHSQVLTDRISFLQQLGLLPADLSKLVPQGAHTTR